MKPSFLFLAKKTNESLESKGKKKLTPLLLQVTTASLWIFAGILNSINVSIYLGLINFLCAFCFFMAARSSSDIWRQEYKKIKANYIESEKIKLNKELKAEKLDKMNFWNDKEKNG